MMSKLLTPLLLLLILSCNSKKQIEKSLHAGNYDDAIIEALRKLETNKNKERKQDYVLMLNNAYEKAVERDLQTIKHLKKDGNPEHYKTIFELYLGLHGRQELIKPALPLQLGGKPLQLNFKDYSDAIAASKSKVSEYMYQNGVTLLNSKDKSVLKEAHGILQYVNQINPKYKDVVNLISKAHDLGTSYVIVSIENQTEKVIPKRLEDDLLNFDTYGLNQFWTVYHARAQPNLKYDYAMALQLKQINISPEQLNEKQLLKEKEIIDGWKYKKDRKGNVMKDSLGNDIKIDNIILAKARYNEYRQFKSTQVVGEVVYINLKNKQVLHAIPISSEFVFENRYATYKGDEKALDKQERDLVRKRRLRFPTNEDMVFDTGEDLKVQLKKIISTFK